MMTDYVTEMMETAGCRKQIMCEWACKDAEICNANCEHFENKQDVFPPFTAEKQINIIKLLGKSTDLHYFGCGMSSLSESTDEGTIEVENDDFAQALAQLTTELMKAGELDKEKVKEVLER